MNIKKIKTPYKLRNNRDTSSGIVSGSVASGGNNSGSWLEQYFTYDEANDALIVNKSFASTGEVMAYADSEINIPSLWESMPYATANSVGGIKVGSGLSITDGVLSIDGTIGTGFDESANYNPSGNWNFTGSLKKDGNDIATQSWANSQFEPAFTKNTAFNKNFAGTGSATTVARSDHNHDNDYHPKGGSSSLDFVANNLTLHGIVNYWLADTITVDDANLQLNAVQNGARVASGLIIFDGDNSTELSKLYYDTDNSWKIDGNKIATHEDNPLANGIAYWDAANSMFKTSSVFIKDGKLGIGTTPDEKLHIEEGKIRVIKTSVGSGITPLIILGVNSTTNGDGAAIDFITSSDGVSVGAQIAGLRTGGGALGSLVFRTRDTSYTLKERMRINQNGNVGINKPDPEERLHIDGNVVVQNYSNPNAFIRLRNSYHGLDLFLQNYYTGQSAVSQFSSYISRSIYIDENGNWKRKSKWSSGSTIRFGESANHVPFISFLIDTDNTTATDTVNLEEAVRITDSLDVKFSSDLQNNGTFVSGFAGSGWKLDGSENHLTVDKLTVRQTIETTEYNIYNSSGTLKWSLKADGDDLAFYNAAGEKKAYLTQNGDFVSMGEVTAYG